MGHQKHPSRSTDLTSYVLVSTFIACILCTAINLVLGNFGFAAVGLSTSSFIGWAIFSNSTNLVQNVGRVYWIIRDTGKPSDPIIARAYMRQISPPWLIGRGIQVRLTKWTFQIGICDYSGDFEEDEGLLRALDGRSLSLDPEEIGEKWNGISAEKTRAKSSPVKDYEDLNS